MFGYKSSKDVLIEFLQAELVRERERCTKDVAELTNVAGRLREENAALQGQLAEALSLAREAIETPAPKEGEPQKPKIRTMQDRCRELSERSFHHARSGGKNLVAQMPPPGAQLPNGAKVAAS